MGDKIIIENIELISYNRFQIDFRNETTGEMYRTFIGHDKLYDMLLSAKKLKETKDAQFNTLINIISGATSNYSINDIDAEIAANRLIDYGIIIPPCKIGTRVYIPILTDNEAGEAVRAHYYTITAFRYSKSSGLEFQIDDENQEYHNINELGYSIFLTETDAIEKSISLF